MVPAAYLGKSPAQLALHPKVMNEVKTQYTVFSVVLGSADDFGLFWHRCGSVPPLFPTPHEKKRLSEYLDLATGFSGRNNTA